MATGRLPDPNTAPVTAKGDLYTYSTVPAKLAVGSNGETLVADSSATTGLRWQSAANSNAVINGGFDFWQRGTSISAGTSASNYSADRWAAVRSANASAFTISRQNTSDTTNLPFIQYCARVARTASNSTTDTIFLATSLESASSIPFAGRTIVFSFYARAGANFSAASSNLSFQVVSGTGTDQNVYTGFTGAAAVINTTATLTTTWQRFTATATVSAGATQLGAYFYYAPVGTAGANDWFEVTGVQLELGSVATTFKRSGGTLAGELAACQRYYYVVASGLDKFVSWSAYYSSTGVAGSVPFKVSMRTTPTLVATTITDGYKISANSDFFTTLNLSSVSNSESGYIYADTNVSGTTGYASYIQTANSGTSVAFNAEL